MASYSATFTGLKFADLPSFVQEAAIDNNLTLSLSTKSEGWFTETVTFKVQGSDYNVRRFMHVLQRAMNDYNNR